MIIMVITFKVPISVIEEHITEHHKFLDECYQNNFFIASGPRNPRTGGVIISLLSDKKQVTEIMSQDPFVIHDLISVEMIEFNPTRYHQALQGILKIA